MIEVFEVNVVKSVSRDGLGGMYIYDGVVVDFEIIEWFFVEVLERDDWIKLYVKLLVWFYVLIFIGSYNFDWVIVFEDKDGVDYFYFVCEIKGIIYLFDL